MADNITKKRRSEIMALVGTKNTKPEMIVRSHLHNSGFRFRLHVRHLPGKPDLVFPGRKVVLFVNGCFWHGHKAKSCKLARTPKSNVSFWETKVRVNSLRDRRNLRKLRDLGWLPLTIWECQVGYERHLTKLEKKIAST